MKLIAAAVAIVFATSIGSAQQSGSGQVPFRVVEQGNFDVLANDYDPNGFPLNPYWRWQSLPGNDRRVPDPDKLCSDGLPNSEGCTSQKTWENLPGIPKVFICMWNFKARLIGHINWIPATYTGGLIWQEKTPDQDCNFGTMPQHNHGLTQGNITSESGLLGLEFDSRETLKQMHTHPWSDLWTKISAGASSSDINRWLSSHTANGEPAYSVLIGLFGVDCEHDCHSELHPIYAIAVQVDPRPENNVWGILVRNWGNEGFCAHGQTNLQLANNGEFKVFLPHQGKVKPTIGDATTFYSTDKSVPPPSVAFVSDPENPGMLLTFKLPTSSSKVLSEFELHLKWSDGSGGPSAGPIPKVTPRAITTPQSVEDYLETVSPALRTRVPSPSIVESPTIGPTEQISLPKPYNVGESASAVSRTPQTTVAQVTISSDSAQQKQDEALFESLCAAYAAQKKDPPNIPKGACAAWKANRAKRDIR